MPSYINQLSVSRTGVPSVAVQLVVSPDPRRSLPLKQDERAGATWMLHGTVSDPRETEVCSFFAVPLGGAGNKLVDGDRHRTRWDYTIPQRSPRWVTR